MTAAKKLSPAMEYLVRVLDTHGYVTCSECLTIVKQRAKTIEQAEAGIAALVPVAHSDARDIAHSEALDVVDALRSAFCDVDYWWLPASTPKGTLDVMLDMGLTKVRPVRRLSRAGVAMVDKVWQ